MKKKQRWNGEWKRQKDEWLMTGFSLISPATWLANVGGPWFAASLMGWSIGKREAEHSERKWAGLARCGKNAHQRKMESILCRVVFAAQVHLASYLYAVSYRMSTCRLTYWITRIPHSIPQVVKLYGFPSIPRPQWILHEMPKLYIRARYILGDRAAIRLQNCRMVDVFGGYCYSQLEIL